MLRYWMNGCEQHRSRCFKGVVRRVVDIDGLRRVRKPTWSPSDDSSALLSTLLTYVADFDCPKWATSTCGRTWCHSDAVVPFGGSIALKPSHRGGSAVEAVFGILSRRDTALKRGILAPA